MHTFDPSDSTILIVDDFLKNIQVLGTTLRENGYEIEYATGGEKALELIEKYDFDLILLDIMMPAIDGYEVCRRVRKEMNNQDIPIIFLTAKTDKDSLIQGFKVGGQDYITKPFDPNELLARVQTHLELRKSRILLTEANANLEENVAQRTKELRQANIELEAANKKLNKLNVAKSNFLSLISHEIRTPLNGICGFADVLQMMLKDTEYAEYVNAIMESADRLEHFAEKALLFTEISSTHENIELKEENIIDIVKDAGENIASIHKKELEVNFTSSIETIKLNCNAELIDIAARNIIENCHKFADTKCDISIEQAEDQCFITFKDDGIGFKEEILNNGFALLECDIEQADQNTGIGLSIVDRIIDLHNGELIYGNNEDKGAFVTFSFSTK